jgi:hypothetical protein
MTQTKPKINKWNQPNNGNLIEAQSVSINLVREQFGGDIIGIIEEKN